MVHLHLILKQILNIFLFNTLALTRFSSRSLKWSW